MSKKIETKRKPERRGTHEGTITFLKEKNLYMGRIQVGLKRKSVYGKTEQEVKEKLRAIAYKYGAGQCYDPSIMTVENWMVFWLNDFKKLNIKPKTYEVYKQFLECHIIPTIGHHTLKNLNVMHLQRLINDKSKELASASIRKMHSIISSALEQALNGDMIPKNPAKAVKLPTLIQKPIKAFTEEELKRFFSVAQKDALFPLFVVAVETGIRLGELLALNWNDINFGEEYISVSKNVIRVEDIDNETEYRNITKVQTTPKTRSSIRKVPLTSTAIRVLASLKQKSNCVLVFCTKTGNYLSARNVERSFYRIVEKAKIGKCGFHTLRHTFASSLVDIGTTPKIVSEFMGHSKVSHTMDIYVKRKPSVNHSTILLIKTNKKGDYIFQIIIEIAH